MLTTRLVRERDLGDVAPLFATSRNTRRCWCMAFCRTRTEFAVGWLSGGNRRRFQSMTSGTRTPLGVLAALSDQPVGGCACGPRSRYAVADSGRSSLLERCSARRTTRSGCCRACSSEQRFAARGLASAVRAAVDVAREEGATALEGGRPRAPDRTDQRGSSVARALLRISGSAASPARTPDLPPCASSWEPRPVPDHRSAGKRATGAIWSGRAADAPGRTSVRPAV